MYTATASGPCSLTRAVRRRSISANASSQLTSTCAPSRRTRGRRRRSGSSWSAPSVEPFGQMKPCENGSSASPRMRVTWPSSTSSCSPHVASQSGHVLNAIRVIPRRYNPRGRQSENQAAATRSRSASRTTGHSSSTTLYQAESRFWPPRTSMCLRWMPSNAAGRPASAGRARSLSASVLNSTRRQPSDVERVLQLEELGLRVRAGAPGRRRQPRPADLEAPVLGSQRQEPGRADGASRGDEHRGERQIEPVVDAVERVVHPGLPLVAGLWLDDRQPPPDPRVARRLPEVVARAPAPAARAARSGPRASV